MSGSASVGAEGGAGAHVGLGNHSVGAYASARVDGTAEVDLGNGTTLDVTVGAEVFAGAYSESYTDGTTARLSNKAGAGITGEVEVGVDHEIGDGQVGAVSEIEFHVGAIAEQNGEANFGDGKYGANADAGAFAGAGVSAALGPTAGYDNVGDVKATTGASIGKVGYGGGGTAGYEDGEITIGSSVELAIGVGVEIDFELKIDTHYIEMGGAAVGDVAVDGAKLVAGVAGDVGAVAEDVAGDVAKAAEDTADAFADMGEAFELAANLAAAEVADAAAAAARAAEAAKHAAEHAERVADAIAGKAQDVYNAVEGQLESFVSDAIDVFAGFRPDQAALNQLKTYLNDRAVTAIGDALGDIGSEIGGTLSDVGEEIASAVADEVGGAISALAIGMEDLEISYQGRDTAIAYGGNEILILNSSDVLTIDEFQF